MREYTNKLLELLDEGYYGEVNPATESLITGLLCWLSEDDVKRFWYVNGYADVFDCEEEEND